MAALWILFCLVFIPQWGVCSSTLEKANVPVSYKTLNFNLETASKSSYTTFVSSLRGKLKGTKEYYGIPMLPEPSKAKDPEQRFLLVGLNVTKEKSITLALDVNNIAKDSLWKDAKERLPIKYPSTYGGIEGKANPRSKVELGIEKLKFAILSVFGKQQIKENLEAKLLLLSVQMVSEATRFKYIEKMILNSIERKGTYKSFFPNPLVISLENGWEDLSEGVRNSKNGVISPAVQLIDPNNKPFKVDKVQAVAPYLSLMNYEVEKPIVSDQPCQNMEIAIDTIL
ncbi:unnamed protein product [Dovyalis caffra]|uniref:rRNA N-glycosylase n=1 Tax=Dovyalis caffra TaxID=77055 RepID=A0AAV1RUK2_9ROSI|nr:unnamed protein product [Dovyalis caffra]